MWYRAISTQQSEKRSPIPYPSPLVFPTRPFPFPYAPTTRPTVVALPQNCWQLGRAAAHRAQGRGSGRAPEESGQQRAQNVADEVDDGADGVLDEPQQLLDGAAETEQLPLGTALAGIEQALETEQGQGLVDDAEEVAEEVLDGAHARVRVEAVAPAQARVEAVGVSGVCAPCPVSGPCSRRAAIPVGKGV